uniref:Putative secreted protein n=1 Tax=Anopheles darlingi TaxID=43151 RepID=A0A2M4DF99_ANODA
MASAVAAGGTRSSVAVAVAVAVAPVPGPGSRRPGSTADSGRSGCSGTICCRTGWPLQLRPFRPSFHRRPRC